MISLTPEQYDNMHINRFIFHVVHHGESEPIFFEEYDIGEFEPFFTDRVKSILNGTPYEFNAQANVSTILSEIADSPALFEERSRQLAVNFHAHGLDDKRIKKGVMILMHITACERDLYAIIKYEHEQVVRYRSDGMKVILENVTDTFTQSPDAMQKAALIELNDGNSEVMILDRNVRGGISGFFQGFLNVRRKKNEKELTETLWDVVKETSKKHADELPQDYEKEIQQRTGEFLQSSDHFNNDRFYETVFGPYRNDSLQNTYRNTLQKYDIENEPFYLDKSAASNRSKVKIKTFEGVTLYFDERAQHTVTINYGQNGEKDVIIIESDKIKEEYL